MCGCCLEFGISKEKGLEHGKKCPSVICFAIFRNLIELSKIVLIPPRQALPGFFFFFFLFCFFCFFFLFFFSLNFFFIFFLFFSLFFLYFFCFV